MPATELFALSMVEFDTAGAVDFDLAQINASRYTPEIRDMLLGGAGEQDASFAAADQVTPRFTVATPQVKAFLDSIQEDGLLIDSGTGAPGVVLYFAQYESGAGRKAGAYNISATVADGIVVPRTIVLTPGQPAILNFDIIALSTDGIATPLAVSLTATIPSVPSASEAFALGPIDVNGTGLDGVSALTIDFGLAEQLLWGDGVPYPTFGCPAPAGGRRPTVSFTTNKASFLNTLGAAGVKISSGVDIYLRKYDEGGTRVANATEEHIKITINEGIVRPANFDGTLGGTIIPTFDGTNNIFVYDTTSAIT